MKLVIDNNGAEISVVDDTVVKTKDGVHFLLTPAEIDERAAAEVVILAEIADYEANHKYKDDRAAAYPSLADQLDMQYHDALNATTTWKDAVAAVKALYPKPVA